LGVAWRVLPIPTQEERPRNIDAGVA